jgi:hypothetical protein
VEGHAVNRFGYRPTHFKESLQLIRISAMILNSAVFEELIPKNPAVIL